jgi:hypothetical protein
MGASGLDPVLAERQREIDSAECVAVAKRHAQVSPEENGNWKIVVSEEPESSERERSDTLDTAALALLGVAESVRRALEISELESEIEAIDESWPKRLSN